MMPTSAVLLKVNAEGLAQSLRDAVPELGGEQAVLDFTSVPRLDSESLFALEGLAAAAQEKGVKLVIRGAGPSVYKTLKLVKLSMRFSFE